jgi:hypothetical protein
VNDEEMRSSLNALAEARSREVIRDPAEAVAGRARQARLSRRAGAGAFSLVLITAGGTFGALALTGSSNDRSASVITATSPTSTAPGSPAYPARIYPPASSKSVLAAGDCPSTLDLLPRSSDGSASSSSVALAFLNARSLAAQRADADQSLWSDLSLDSSKVISADVTVGPLTGVTASTVAETCGVSVADSTWVGSVCYSGAETFAECRDAHPALVSEIFALDRSERYLDWLIP